jgi:hydroxyethylthiazole kinase-like uncharacterized protein yjeF
MFGYKPTVFMPKVRVYGSNSAKRMKQPIIAGLEGYIQGNALVCDSTRNNWLKRLQQQTENLSIPSLSTIQQLQGSLKETDVILDAIFGFSFSGPVRPPFDEVLALIAKSKLPIVSVDIPSGWDVELGPVEREVANAEGKRVEEVLMPDVLVSLTAPKQGVKGYKGRHFLGGRFVPWYVSHFIS